MPSKRVSLLSRQNTEKLIRISEERKCLNWEEKAIDRIWNLTHGHPFLTQALCSQVWELVNDNEPEGIPYATEVDVEKAIWETIDKFENPLNWLWEGLGPAERVVISALACAGVNPVSETQLEEILRDSGIRILIRQLREAPALLQEWDIIEPNDQGYSFRVELIRLWVQHRRPLKRIQRELDRIQPAAESLFQAASDFYVQEDFGQAMPLLLQALRLNPQHLGASELLAEIYILIEKLDDAQKILEPLLGIYPNQVTPRLLQIYLLKVKAESDNNKKFALLNAALSIDPKQSDALSERRKLLDQVIQECVNKGAYDKALEYCQTIGDSEILESLRRQIRRIYELAGDEALANRNFEKAFQDYGKAGTTEKRDFVKNLILQQRNLSLMFTQGLQATKEKKWEDAKQVFISIIKIDEHYEYSGKKVADALADVFSAEQRSASKGKILQSTYPISLTLTIILIISIGIGIGWKLVSLSTIGIGTFAYLTPPTNTPTHQPIITSVSSTDAISIPMGTNVFSTPIPTPSTTPTIGPETIETALFSSKSVVSLNNVKLITKLSEWTERGYKVLFVLSPNGRLLASSNGHSINLRHTENVDPYYGLPVSLAFSTSSPSADLSAMAFSPDNSLFAISSDFGIELWGVYKKEFLGGYYEIIYGKPSGLAFSPNGLLLAYRSLDYRTITIFDISNGKLGNPYRDAPFFAGSSVCFAFSPDSKYLAVGYENGDVAIYYVHYSPPDVSYAKLLELNEAGNISDLAFSPDGQYLFVLHKQGIIQKIRLSDHATVFIKELDTKTANRVVISPDGSAVFISGEEETILVLDPEQGIIVNTIVAVSGINNISITSDGKMLAISSDPKFQIWGILKE